MFDIKRSLSRKGNPYDNAVVESTNRLLKKELVYRNHYTHDRAAEARPQRLRVVVRQPAAPLHPWIPESEGIHRTGTRPLRNRPTHRCQSRLRRAEREDRLDTELRQIAKARLLIIDEFGYMPIDEEGSRLLFQVISDSYETRSVVYTTNIEFSGWGRVLGDKNMAAALIDRTVHHGRLAGFEGGSYRSEHALMTR